MASSEAPAPVAAVLAPSPVLTVTIEVRGTEPEVHLHAGGQGFWIARMIRSLGTHVVCCGSFGGETGLVVRTLMEREGVEVRAVRVAGDNAIQLDDRRGGASTLLVATAPHELTRHELDELYGAMVVRGLAADVSVLAGSTSAGGAPSADVYRRLCADLRANDGVVVADVSGKEIEAVLRGGVTVLKVSEEDLLSAGMIEAPSRERVVDAVERMCDAGTRAIVVSRAEQPAIAALHGEIVEVDAPRLEPLEPRGAGDAMTAGIAATLASGHGLDEALRVGCAAGALNVARRGFGSGHPAEISAMAAQVRLRSFGERAPVTITPDELAARARKR